MKLIELIDNLDSLSDDLMIFIASHEPVREDIEAITASIQEESTPVISTTHYELV